MAINIVKLPIEKLRRDGGTQPRTQTDWIVVDEYAEAMRNGTTFPVVAAYFDGTSYWLADGFHRVEAALKAGNTEIGVDVRQGTQRDAILHSVGANDSHGLRRTNEDKRRAVLRLLEDEEWGSWSDNAIAAKCAVSQPFVSKIRSENLSYNDYKIERTVQRNGTVYTQNTTNIGKPAEPKSYPNDAILPNGHNETYTAARLEPEPITNGYGNMTVHFSSETPEHYTPQIVIDAVIECLGGIDLDPCSNNKTRPNVPAQQHFTVEDDGLALPWRGKVYMNPPYGREIDVWIEKLCSEHAEGDVTEAIALVPSRTDTQWWQRLSDYPVCLVIGRLKFGQAENSAPFPSAIFYLGNDVGKFYRSFSHIGDIWQKTPYEWIAE